ncbi:MAG TPA: hypothetical protein VFC09_13940 [Candidatus Dormibacteraeota bacterium]|nr:hypothetical protein [Candidatus Dormibacteraeota bacterium]
MMHRARATVAIALLAPLLAGCGPYLLRQSDRLQITSPQISTTVAQPLTVSWRAQDFSAPRDGRFAVFVDRDPIAPGSSIDDLAPQDRAGVYVVSTTSLQLKLLIPLAGVDPAEQNHHDVTVVMLDRQGNRIGEYAGFTEFDVVHRS